MKKMLLILTATLFFSGCFSGSKPTHYYTISLDTPSTSKTYPQKVFIQKTSIESAYKRANIVYRESPYEFMYYGSAQWAMRPEIMVQQAIKSYLEESKLFSEVDTTPIENPDFELQSQVIALEEIDEENARYAHVAIKLSFNSTKDVETLWSKTYNEKESYAGEDVREMVKATSNKLSKFMKDAVFEIENVLKNIPEKDTQNSSLKSKSAVENVFEPENVSEEAD